MNIKAYAKAFSTIPGVGVGAILGETIVSTLLSNGMMLSETWQTAIQLVAVLVVVAATVYYVPNAPVKPTAAAVQGSDQGG